MTLTATQINNAKPKDRPYKMGDAHGLFLLVTPKGEKWWRLKFYYAGKEKKMSLGVYPAVTLKEAREKRDAQRKLLDKGINPSLQRKLEKAGLRNNSFEVVAREWFEKHSPGWAKGHSEKIIRRLERDIFPYIGERPTTDIKAPEILLALRRIENRQAIETAHRALQNCSAVFRYGVATGRAERDPCFDLRGALPPAQPEHHASITEPKAVGALLRAIDGYKGSEITRIALKLAPLVFVRPGELRKAEWSEFDCDEAEWRIPAYKMKMGSIHIVPLSKQSLALVSELRPLTGGGKYLFPGVRSSDRAHRPMSENTVNAALRRLGYGSDQMTGHGFRSMASTLLNEQGCWRPDAIERQLAHMERDRIRGSYNYAEHLPERRKMMQAWADYLDDLAASTETTPTA